MEANGGVHPGSIVAVSKKKYKWRCREGHAFEASARSRTVDGTQCHYCTGQKTDPKRSIAVTRPELVKQWDVTKNLPLTPAEVLPGSGKLVHWRCDKGPDHQWRSTVASRATDDEGCPYCARRRLSVTNSLQAIAPQLAAEWHPTHNGDLTPKDVLGGGHRKVFWQCPKGPDHEWVATLASRLAGNGCPCCRGLKVSVTNSLKECVVAVLRQVEHVTGTKVGGLGAYSRSPRLAKAAEARAYIDELLARQKARKAGRRRSRHRRPQRRTADTSSTSPLSRSTRRR